MAEFLLISLKTDVLEITFFVKTPETKHALKSMVLISNPGTGMPSQLL